MILLCESFYTLQNCPSFMEERGTIRIANLILSGAYNHFLTSYASSSKLVSSSDTHKKDELKNIYKSIVKHNTDSPLYVLSQDDAFSDQSSAIDLKEQARLLSSQLSDINSGDANDESGGNAYSQKIAFSSNDDAVSVSYVGALASSSNGFELHVDRLASSQQNTGEYLPSDQKINLDPGSYFFDARVGDQSYEFQFSINDNDTNLDVQERVSRLINKAGISLESSVDVNDNSESAIVINSQVTGLSPGKDSQFEIYDALSSPHHGTVPYLGLNNTTNNAENALFTIDGNEHTSASNTFTVGSAFKLTLHDINAEGESTSIGLEKDNDALLDRVYDIVDNYNDFVDNVSQIDNVKYSTNRVLDQVSQIVQKYANDMEPLGISMTNDGYLDIDDQLATQDIGLSSKEFSDEFKPVFDFASSLSKKMNEYTIDPMKFSQRPIVNYKNPGHSLPSPYISSEYSGMLYNNYI